LQEGFATDRYETSTSNQHCNIIISNRSICFHSNKLDTHTFAITNSQVNVLYDANVAPGTRSKIMELMNDGQIGMLLPKTIFNITEKGRTLLGMADGILDHTTDAEKQLCISISK
jgi:hypothetical protein